MIVLAPIPTRPPYSGVGLNFGHFADHFADMKKISERVCEVAKKVVSRSFQNNGFAFLETMIECFVFSPAAASQQERTTLLGGTVLQRSNMGLGIYRVECLR